MIATRKIKIYYPGIWDKLVNKPERMKVFSFRFLVKILFPISINSNLLVLLRTKNRELFYFFKFLPGKDSVSLVVRVPDENLIHRYKNFTKTRLILKLGKQSENSVQKLKLLVLHENIGIYYTVYYWIYLL